MKFGGLADGNPDEEWEKFFLSLISCPDLMKEVFLS
jgi:hypothetical protein